MIVKILILLIYTSHCLDPDQTIEKANPGRHTLNAGLQPGDLVILAWNTEKLIRA